MRAPAPPHLDGTLDDEVWALAPPITGFTQQEPDTGSPATEATTVRVLFDDHALYIGAQLDDSQPITKKLARRDSFLAADWFAVYLDTHHDHRVARMFRVGAAGVLRDSIVEGDDFGDEDRSWDPVWDGVAAPTPTGWSVEMRIPYSQLRFPDLPAQVWGINFHREISRTNEYSRLVHVPRNESGFIARFAHLIGIEGIEPPRRLEVLPYAITRSRNDGSADPSDPFAADGDPELDGGVDLEYGLASNLTLSATINPDFGQVEADPAELNLTEFEIFYDEKRPFFLEGADLFSFRAADLFYSRRIGRPPQGSLPPGAGYHDSPSDTTIAGAVKLSGKTAGGWSVGVLDAWTGEESARYQLGDSRHAAVVEPATNYFVGRLARDLSDSSTIGGMITAVNRSDGSSLLLHDQSYTGGIDGVHYFGNRDYILEWGAFGSQISGSRETIAATQRSPGHYFHRPDADHLDYDPERTSLTGWGAYAGFEKETGRLRYSVISNASSPELEINDLGFRTRTDTIGFVAEVGWNDPEPRGRIRSRFLEVAKQDGWNFGSDHRADRIAARGGMEFSNYWRAEFYVGRDGRAVDDRATRGGPLAATPSLTLYEIEISTDHRKRVNAELELAYDSNELGGFDRDVEFRVQWQPAERATLEIAPRWSDSLVARQFVRRVADPAAAATYGARYVFAPVETNELDLTTRFDLAITRNLTFQLYLQPFVARGDYDGFRELARPASLDYLEYGVDGGSVAFDAATNFYTIDPDASGPGAPFTFRNPDFNERSLRGNAVVRWEFRPGATAYFVWSQNRSGRVIDGEFDPGRDLDALAGLPADDVFMVKVSYWLGL
ncbi:MAG TPA: DUF5916 domain-containing protein [Thermoanaerobaculia bacterium]|nr:DUF5916 domain-containing protein [Thermoanaerobaculia bacterium]